MAQASQELITNGSAIISTRDDWRLARMTEHDLNEVVEIEESCGLSRWGWDAYYAELSRPETIMLVARLRSTRARQSRELCGFVAARVIADELHINNIAVREGWRRSGAASALLRSALRGGMKLGARASVLEVRAGNVAAQMLYERHGFHLVGRRRNYYREPPEDALLMRAVLES